MKWTLCVVAFVAAVFHSSGARAEKTCNSDRTQCCEWWSIEVTSTNGAPGLLLEDSFDKLQRRLVSDQETGVKLCRYFGPSDSTCSTTYGAPTCAMGNRPSQCDGAAVEFDQWSAQLQRDLTNVAKLEHPYTKLRDAVTAWGHEKVRDGDSDDERANPFEHVGTVLGDYKDALTDAVQRVRTAQTILQRVVKQGPVFVNPYMHSLRNAPLLSPWNTRGEFAGADEKDAANCDVAAVEQAVRQVGRLRAAIGRIPTPPELVIERPIDKVTIAKQSKSSRLVIGGWQLGKIPPAFGRHPIAWVDSRRRDHYDVKIETLDGPEGRIRIRVTAGPPTDPTVVYLDGLAPDRDGDGFFDARDRCPDVVGRAPAGCPPTCGGGKYWTGDTCACPDERPRWRGTRCEACPSSTEWTGARCERVEQHVATAPPPQVIGPASCPSGTMWTGTSCGAVRRCGELLKPHYFQGGMGCARGNGRPLDTPCRTVDEASNEMDRRCREPYNHGDPPRPALGNRCVVPPQGAAAPPGAKEYTQGPVYGGMWCVP